MADARQHIAVWLYEEIGGYNPDDGVNHDDAKDLLAVLDEVCPGDYIAIEKSTGKMMGLEMIVQDETGCSYYRELPSQVEIVARDETGEKARTWLVRRGQFSSADFVRSETEAQID